MEPVVNMRILTEYAQKPPWTLHWLDVACMHRGVLSLCSDRKIIIPQELPGVFPTRFRINLQHG